MSYAQPAGDDSGGKQRTRLLRWEGSECVGRAGRAEASNATTTLGPSRALPRCPAAAAPPPHAHARTRCIPPAVRQPHRVFAGGRPAAAARHAQKQCPPFKPTSIMPDVPDTTRLPAVRPVSPAAPHVDSARCTHPTRLRLRAPVSCASRGRAHGRGGVPNRTCLALLPLHGGPGDRQTDAPGVRSDTAFAGLVASGSQIKTFPSLARV